MYYIYVDDIRNPDDVYDIVCRTTNDTVKAIRRKYKEGIRSFYLDLDHDAGDVRNLHGGDFINVLKQIDAYVHMGRMQGLNLNVHFHSMNSVGIQNMRQIVQHSDYMKEI